MRRGVKSYTKSGLETGPSRRTMHDISCNALSGSMDAVAFR
ncbi:MAG: hypothetical protein QOD24_125 [Solirubrobacteraceae bacterium]|jgi:hypothetical protein|nr:hypothetical protein [Solirubrobacteraceae bacterium]